MPCDADGGVSAMTGLEATRRWEVLDAIVRLPCAGCGSAASTAWETPHRVITATQAQCRRCHMIRAYDAHDD